MSRLPWRFAIRYVARKQGLPDPIAMLARLHSFTQLSAAGEPIELLRVGAIGSLAVGYPPQLWAPADPRMLDCVEFLLERCFVKEAVCQDMIHSGLNAYFTLHAAQILLRVGGDRYLELMDAMASLVSHTGQWPEAIHPLTESGGWHLEWHVDWRVNTPPTKVCLPGFKPQAIEQAAGSITLVAGD